MNCDILESSTTMDALMVFEHLQFRHKREIILRRYEGLAYH